jgi:hypothetical protein
MFAISLNPSLLLSTVHCYCFHLIVHPDTTEMCDDEDINRAAIRSGGLGQTTARRRPEHELSSHPAPFMNHETPLFTKAAI